MNSYLRQSTASQSRAIGPFLDDTDFKTAETGLTIANTDIKLVANGGASANKNAGGGTHRVNGEYGITFDATDTATVGELNVSVVMAGALPVFHTFQVLEEAVYDALFLASAPGYLQPATPGRTADVDASGRLLLQPTQTGVTIPTVTTLTNAPSDSAGVTTLLTRVPSALFAGITSLAQWLGIIAGKQTGNSTARTELRATGAGSGTFDETTDALEALRDRGDAAWTTGTGGGGLDAPGVRAAIGLASANLDAQLDALPTATELTAALATADDATLAAIAALFTTVMTESYAADGAAMTMAQALYEIRGLLSEFSISGTTLTLKKKDGSTTAATYTLDSATSPTSITRAS